VLQEGGIVDAAPAASVAEAARTLQQAVRDGANELGALDAGAGRGVLERRLHKWRPPPAPPGLEPRAARLLSDALRMQMIVDIAQQEEASNVAASASLIRHRASVLSPLGSAARRAVEAAVEHASGPAIA
jgi:hypothetical protein